ncbi:MAG TPA: glycosyltransferase family 1 protein [Vicinamibacterales bacterium]|nr:glycosyltransferase family 1 protein [Vicinamibacterales bacterium]
MSARVIGIDARELLGATTGVGRYLGELLRRWTARPDAASRRFVLYTPEALGLRFESPVDERVLRGGRGTWWEQTTLRTAVDRDAPDVFFAPAYTAPLGLRMPLAVTIHDVSFSAHPEWFRWREGTRRRWLTRRAARDARLVFTDSEFSRGEIVRHYDVPPERIEVIPPGLGARASGVTSRREPLVLYAGSLFNRRRLPDLIAAFAIASRDVPLARLVIAGDDRTWPAQDLGAVARDHGVAGRVEQRNYVSDEELASLYARACVFAFLSEYEGFGLTPLEALAAGVPIVVLDTAVSREVYGEAAQYVAKGDIAGAAAAIGGCLASARPGAEQLARAPAVLARYSWDQAAERTLAGLDRIVPQ